MALDCLACKHSFYFLVLFIIYWFAMVFYQDNNYTYVVVVPIGEMGSDMDVVFLIDASNGVTNDDLTREKDFVLSLAARFGISPNGPRGSAVTYATRNNTVAGFTDPAFSRQLERARLLREPRRIDNVLREAAKLLASTQRTGPKAVVLLIAGRQRYDPRTEPLRDVVKPLQRIGAKVYVVTIGREPSNQILVSVVSRPKDIFRIPSSANLPSQVKPVEKSGKLDNLYFLLGKQVCDTD